jgi:hypothetical protein
VDRPSKAEADPRSPGVQIGPEQAGSKRHRGSLGRYDPGTQTPKGAPREATIARRAFHAFITRRGLRAGDFPPRGHTERVGYVTS